MPSFFISSFVYLTISGSLMLLSRMEAINKMTTRIFAGKILESGFRNWTNAPAKKAEIILRVAKLSSRYRYHIVGLGLY